MKNLLAIIILSLCFVTSSNAEDIRDFQIEGMSIGDSLLKFYSKKEIKNNYHFERELYKNQNEVNHIVLFKKPYFKNYDSVQIHFEKNDSRFVIIGIDGMINFPDNFNACKKKMSEIAFDLDKSFNFDEKRTSEGLHPGDKTGKSKFSKVSFFLKPTSSGAEIEIICYDNSKEFKYVDKLTVTFYGAKYSEFLENYYK
tara:strand:+ start:1154 stop:1747 length:594 start_codon:yes stop_codon:yes gene_type:complete